MHKSTDSIIKKTNIEFKNLELLEMAFTHRSYLNEAGKNKESNERLEFLGDAILSYIVSKHLYQKFSKKPEGQLTNIRSILVKTTTLADLAQELHFGEFLLLSRGEEESSGRKNTSLLADVYEAFLGALFLDQGIEKTEDFLKFNLFPKIDTIISEQIESDHKSKLQEIVQTYSNNAPTYKVVKSEGPDHNKTFWVVVVIDGKEHEIGKGKSKQEAEQSSAALTLEKIDKN